jgi:hypothetical protein
MINIDRTKRHFLLFAEVWIHSFPILGNQNYRLPILWTPGLISAASHVFSNSTLDKGGFPDSEAFGFELSHTTNITGSLPCRQPFMGQHNFITTGVNFPNK